MHSETQKLDTQIPPVTTPQVIQSHMRKSSNVQRVCADPGTPTFFTTSTLDCTEWKQAYKADLPTELLQLQSKWWLSSSTVMESAFAPSAWIQNGSD